MTGPTASLILANADVITGDRAMPRAGAVGIEGERVVWVGEAGDAQERRSPGVRVIDCQGKTLIPGLIDAHIHLFAYAANLVSVDCSPGAVRSIAGIQEALARRTAATPSGAWLRGWGYDDFHLAEGRHPTRRELDVAAPANPVKLTHRSGHACVLNSLAMERLGITGETPETPGGLIERDLSTGELTGLLLEMDPDSSGPARAPTVTEAELDAGLDRALRELLSLGVTSIHEATATGAIAQWDRLQAMRQAGRLPVRVHKMVGPGDLDELRARDLFFGAGDPALSVGAVKIMLNETGDPVLPRRDELRELVYAAHRAGYQVAFHCAGERGVEAAADAVEQALARSLAEAPDIAAFGLRLHDHRHRIEHCGVCPPALAERLRAAGLIVVTQPGFVAANGDRYLAQAPPDQRPWLYAVGGLRRAGLRVAFGSDAPVAPLDPFASMGAAVTRRTARGAVLGAQHAVSPAEALAMHTAAAAYASSDEHDRGAIAPGMLADLALLDASPLAVDPETIKAIRPLWTMVGGRIVWER